MIDDPAVERLLDHGTHPRHWALLDPCDFDHAGRNPLCGDHLRITARLDADNRVCAVGWAGEGCLISKAAASLLGERLLGLMLTDVSVLTADDMLTLVGVRLTPNRVRCAVLALEVVKRGIEQRTNQR